ncbi:MAG: hypothetical protein M1834_004209 [Cirrosporium novae-zelandiae]|nr:MAG: hypothetical protein M1834_004209 [Cirrosporium novae-zelandiae]
MAPIPRSIRIAGASGATSDRRHAIAHFARRYPSDPVDVITGDWLSEANMTTAAGKKADQLTTVTYTSSQQRPLNSAATEAAYEASFLEALEPALGDIKKYGIKIAVNAGGNDTKLLVNAVEMMVKNKGLDLRVAWIEGDDVLSVVRKAKPSDFTNIHTGQRLSDWKFNPISAQAYLGGLGIAAALSSGADIVLCGRVADASSVIGAAAWWHKWSRDDLECLANTLVAGHLIECSNYVCGGNFSGFKTLEEEGWGWSDIGYPIAEISSTGSTIITKALGTQGLVSPETCKAHFLYEIQGPYYYNSDVTALLADVSFISLGNNRVGVSGVQALPPPPTTKVGITAKGGFQAEMHYFLCGLDIHKKAQMMEQQLRKLLAPHSKNFTMLSFTIIGSVLPDPEDQNFATVVFRIFAQAPNMEHLASAKFMKPIIDNVMQGYPGATFHMDFRQGAPKPVFEYFVTLMPQTEVRHIVHTHDHRNLKILPPSNTRVYERQQPSEEVTKEKINPKCFGDTVRGPLGWIVHARSGDKGSDANVGFFVRRRDEYAWLRNLLSVQKIKELLGKEYKEGMKIVGLPKNCLDSYLREQPI